MPDITTTTKGVAKCLHELKTNKSTGPDDVPGRILQLAANELIAPAFRVIFQRSITTGELRSLSPLQANITPIFKKGDRTLPSNYRPISLTSISCKLLEHIIYSYNYNGASWPATTQVTLSAFECYPCGPKQNWILRSHGAWIILPQSLHYKQLQICISVYLTSPRSSFKTPRVEYTALPAPSVQPFQHPLSV